MQKVSYMGDGTTTEFSFNFPYFENDNIIVTKNNTTATGYNIVGTSAAPDADIPYTGGKVVFDIAPSNLDSITIARSLPLTRTVDYQPTAKIEPTTLNQDMNYLMEILKDFSDDLESFATQYAEIVDKESVTDLLAQITTIHDEIVTVSAQITALGDITTLRQNVTTNTENITTNSTDITNLKNATNFTTTGKAAITNMGMPSNEFENLTLGTDGSTYTAPADGYLYLSKNSTASGQRIKLTRATQMSVSSWSSGTQNLEVVLPVSKGDVITIYYTAGGTTNFFRFIYANGSK